MAYINGKEILFSAIVDTVEQSQLRELQAENNELQLENDGLQLENDELQAENDLLVKSNNSWRAENNKLTAQNTELTTENQELTANNTKLTSQVETLTSENTELQSKNDALTAQNTELTAQNTELTAQNTELTTENQELTTENIEVKARVNELEVENETIAIENDELTMERNELLDNFTDVIQGNTSEIIIPDGVTSIRQYAFYSCGNATAFAFPDTVSLINGAAFANCTNCKQYDFRKHDFVPTLGNVNCFNNINANAEILVPKSLYSQWIAATNWSTYSKYIVSVLDSIVNPSNDSEVETAEIHTASTVSMGFYFSENLRAGTRYVEHTWIDYDTERTDVYELSEAVGTRFTMGEWERDSYEESGYNVSGEFYHGQMTFYQSGTYRIYQKYYDAAGNEFETGSYIFEVI